MTAGYPAVDETAPDSDLEVICRGCSRLTCQVSNQSVYITFGQGEPPQYGQPEPYLPFVGQLRRDFDAFKVRAYTPAAQLPAGAIQAQVKLIPLPDERAEDDQTELDQLQPNVLTVNPDGTINITISGTVSAHGFKFYDDTYGFVYKLTSARPASSQPVWSFVGPLWSDAKALGLTWGQLKTLGLSSWSAFRKYIVQQRGL